jgi:hypothetical protein
MVLKKDPALLLNPRPNIPLPGLTPTGRAVSQDALVGPITSRLGTVPTGHPTSLVIIACFAASLLIITSKYSDFMTNVIDLMPVEHMFREGYAAKRE